MPETFNYERKSQGLTVKPYTLNSKPYTLHPKPYTLHPNPTQSKP